MIIGRISKLSGAPGFLACSQAEHTVSSLESKAFPHVQKDMSHSQNAGRGGGSAQILVVGTWAASVIALVASFSTAGAEIGLGQFHTYDTPTRVMFRMSSVEIGPTARQGAVAEVIFHNTNTNGHDDERRKTVTLNGMSVDVVFGFNVNAETHDQITIYPPDGFIAIPDTLTLPEESEGVSYIYPEEVPLG